MARARRTPTRSPSDRPSRAPAPRTEPRATPPPPAPSPDDAPLDGRRARTVRTRAAILAALLDLVRAGDINPSAAAIAKRARISVRSIGQHFPSRAELFAAASAAYLRRADPPEPDVTAALADRLAAFLAVRTRELETSRPIRASAALFAAEYPVVADAIAGNAARRREQVLRVFAPEVARGGPDTDELLDLVLGGRVWDALRERGLPADRCAALVARLARLVLAAP